MQPSALVRMPCYSSSGMLPLKRRPHKDSKPSTTEARCITKKGHLRADAQRRGNCTNAQRRAITITANAQRRAIAITVLITCRPVFITFRPVLITFPPVLITFPASAYHCSASAYHFFPANAYHFSHVCKRESVCRKQLPEITVIERTIFGGLAYSCYFPL